MLSNFAYWWLAGGDDYDDETAARTLTQLWARALGLRHAPGAGPAPAPAPARQADHGNSRG
jgi:hypothetical protein